MRLSRLLVAFAYSLIGLTAAFAANDTRPVVGPGATKEDVINAYGWPNGQSQSGTKEILSYSQGEVVLESGKVERVNFSPDVPWQAPRPRPAAPTASTRKIRESPVDYWLTSYPDALREAQRRQSRILALFTGSDWSPASRQFHDQIEYHPDFINAFAGDVVFLKLDYPRGSPVPAKISDENLLLRDQYGVTTYPTLLVLSSTGDLLARVDLSKASDTPFRERVIAAVRDALIASGAAPAPAPKPAAATPPPTPPAVPANVAPAPTTSSGPQAPVGTPAAGLVWTAGKLITLALFGGGALVIAAWWWLWRQRQPRAKVPPLEIAERIDAAAGGMPAPTEMVSWSKEKLVAVVAGLAEFDNFAAHVRPGGGDADIELRKRGDVNPRVLVTCVAGADGAISAKRLRELFATLAAEGVESGWVVSPAGFTNEARAYGPAHRIALVGPEGLHNLMREVPPVSLPAVLARE